MENNNKELRIPIGRRRTGWLFTRVADGLISGLPRTNPNGRTSPEVQLSNQKATLPLLKFLW